MTFRETHELRFVGGPMDGHTERFPARPIGEHEVVFPVPEPFTASMAAEGYVPSPYGRRVTYRERCRLHRKPPGKSVSELHYIEMGFAP